MTVSTLIARTMCLIFPKFAFIVAFRGLRRDSRHRFFTTNADAGGELRLVATEYELLAEHLERLLEPIESGERESATFGAFFRLSSPLIDGDIESAISAREALVIMPPGSHLLDSSVAPDHLQGRDDRVSGRSVKAATAKIAILGLEGGAP